MPDVSQSYELVNLMAKTALGETAVVTEDWSNINDIGTDIISSTENVEKATGVLVDRIGKVIYANDRNYEIDGPDLVVDNREYASITQKMRLIYPEATPNQSYLLTDDQVYEQDQYHAPQLRQHFWDDKTTFEIDRPSLPLHQFKSAFLNADAWMAFEAMYRKAWSDQERYLTERLTKGLVSTRIARELYAAYTGGTYTGDPGTARVYNLRKMYNDATGENLTQAQAMFSGDFIRFAFYQIERIARNMRSRKTIYNADGQNVFTPTAYLRAVFLSDFVSAADYYLYNGLNQYLTERMALPTYYTITEWQGSGTAGDTVSASTINKTFKDAAGTSRSVNATGIIGALYDRDALVISPYELRGYTHFNKAAEFINPFYKRDVGFIDALDENFVVFTIS